MGADPFCLPRSCFVSGLSNAYETPAFNVGPLRLYSWHNIIPAAKAKELHMNAHEWKKKGSFFEFGKHRIFFVTEPGSGGEPLLCLHGFPTSSWDYHKIWDALAEEYSVYAYDMIGYGFSDKPAGFPYTTADQADVLQTLAAAMGLKSFHVLSHDYGNTIIQETLAREREGKLDFDIETICFMNGALFPETHRPILAQKLLIGPVGPIFGRLIPDPLFKRSLASVFGSNTRPTDEEMAEYVRIFKHKGGRRISHKLIQYMRERTTYRSRWVESLVRMTQPFRLIDGLDDPVSGRHLVERFREVVPEQHDVVEIEGVGHFPHFEVPETVIARYREFREKNRQKS